MHTSAPTRHKVGNPSAEDKAVDVLGFGQLLRVLVQTGPPETPSDGLRVREVSQSHDMSHRLGDEVTPIRRRRFDKRIGVPGVDLVILEEGTPAGHSEPTAMFWRRQSDPPIPFRSMRIASRTNQSACRNLPGAESCPRVVQDLHPVPANGGRKEPFNWPPFQLTGRWALSNADHSVSKIEDREHPLGFIGQALESWIVVRCRLDLRPFKDSAFSREPL